MTEILSTAQPLPLERPNPFDPAVRLGALREQQPISRLAFPDGHVGWLVTSHELARAVLADSRFSARQELRHMPVEAAIASELTGPARPGQFARMDPPDHTRYRRLLTGQFTVRRMKQLEPRIAEIVDAQLEHMAAAGAPADLVEEFALPVPSLVICELLGVPYEERSRFQRDTATIVRFDAQPEHVRTAMRNLYAYFGELAERKLTKPGDDLLSGLARSGELTHEELTTIAFILLFAGHETTANMLALGTFALLQHPEQLAVLKAGGDPALIENAVEELMRYLSIIHIGPLRVALEDFEFGGRQITAGENVVISTPAANRDPAKFGDPERLDLRQPATGHVGFGHGVHQCLGQQLARIEMRIGFSALFARFPDLRLAVAPEDVPLRTNMVIYGVHRLPVEW